MSWKENALKQFETSHYLFNYRSGSIAERDIIQIAQMQEACYHYICNVLGANPTFRIEYFLCESPEEVGEIYGDNEPCNGFACPPNKVYSVYNNYIKCVGFHEDSHLISYTINRPDSPAVREGLAMYFDRRWWGIHNMDWALYYLEHNMCMPIDDLLDQEFFFSQDCALTYPIMGAFTEFLISTYGIDKYKEFYRSTDLRQAMHEIFGKTICEDFFEYLRLFRLDDGIKHRIAELLNQ